MKLRRSDGTEIHALVSATSVHDESGAYAGSLSMIRDVTESVAQEERRAALEEQLRQSQRLESIGHLAGGIAHDFNNLLLGDPRLRRARARAPRARRGRRRRRHQGHPARPLTAPPQLTRQLLAFGRRQVLQPESLDLHEVVADMEKLLRG